MEPQAKQKAIRDKSLYTKAQKRFGGIISPLRGGAPIGLFIGHLLRINPSLKETLPVKKDRRRGFLKASCSEARTVNVAYEQLDDPSTCAFIYSRELNKSATFLYTTYGHVFTEASKDLWKCAYLHTTLENAAFKWLWDKAYPTIETTEKPVWESHGRGSFGNWKIRTTTTKNSSNDAYSDIIETTKNLTTSPAGYKTTPFKHLIAFECEYVFALWKLYGSGTFSLGKLPVLSTQQTHSIMGR